MPSDRQARLIGPITALGHALAQANGQAVAREISSRPNRRNAIALTFDDGPADWTEPILDTLRDSGVCATFFVLGESIGGKEHILDRTAREGHEVGNHTFSHRRLDAGVSPAEIEAELNTATAAIRNVTGESPRLFRPPHLASSSVVRRAAGACGFAYVIRASLWTGDWYEESSNEIVEAILGHPELVSGAIIDLHDGRPQNGNATRRDRVPTVEAVRQIVPGLLNRGFRLVTVSELLALPSTVGDRYRASRARRSRGSSGRRLPDPEG